ncbi:fatty acid binding protein [Cryptosporidium hominis]|uniref:Fatty acid binding protein n=2 Tax=Cryptosporidium hominis TaxID=237895 RepID=A0ABX5BE52_CRYHO|nr:fatty acid binding protein [Cryptosporidium hominis]|eukprot:PPS94421.1 fatty acid binding protein [Cryptosporidium hominis]
MCDCFTFLRQKEDYSEFRTYDFGEHFEISITSVESPGDGQISLDGTSTLYDEIMFCYSQLLENDDYNLYVPIEGNPNFKEELPKLLSNVGFKENFINYKKSNQNVIEKLDDLKKRNEKNQKCVQDLVGSWQIISEESDNMEQFLQKIGVGMLKRKVINKGSYTLKVEISNEKLLLIKIEPFFGPTQILNWDLSGEIFIEKNPEVGIWRNRVEFIEFKHEKTNNQLVTAICMTRESENLPGKVIETRWTQPGDKNTKIKFIRYRFIDEFGKCTIDVFRAFKPK